MKGGGVPLLAPAHYVTSKVGRELLSEASAAGRGMFSWYAKRGRLTLLRLKEHRRDRRQRVPEPSGASLCVAP